MKKKLLLFTSIGAVFLVGISAVAISGVNQLDRLQVKADPIEPTEYSVTFNESNTTVDDLYGHWVISTTTAGGNKVGVVGWYNGEAWFTFKKVSFQSLMLCYYDMLMGGDAQPFSTITGFAISFSGKEEEPVPMDLVYGEMLENIIHVASGTEYKGLSITPDDQPEFMPGDGVTVTSLTIWYSC